MRIIATLGILALTTLAAAQTCPPPGCTLTCTQGDLAGYECATRTPFHRVLSDGTQLAELQIPAAFDATGLTGTTSLGGVSLSFAIGSANQTTTMVEPVANGLQCVGTSGNTYSITFPIMVPVSGVTTTISGKNPLYCQSATRALLCFHAKGRPPFPTTLGCTIDSLDFVCGVVS